MFYRVIEVREQIGAPVIEYLKWDNMRFDVVFKWEWYFKYRAALLQIKYPKYRVDLIKGSVEATGLTAIQLQRKSLKNRITTCKRMITKLGNAIEEYEIEQSKLLLPNYDNPDYQKAKTKLKTYSLELIESTNELTKLKDKI